MRLKDHIKGFMRVIKMVSKRETTDQGIIVCSKNEQKKKYIYHDNMMIFLSRYFVITKL